MKDKDKCYLTYKNCECNYKGDLSSCDKTLDDCKKHNNITSFPCNPFEELINKRDDCIG